MSIDVRALFAMPRRELASELAQAYADCAAAHLVTGFMTVEGVDALLDTMRTEPKKLQALITGAATWRALDAFDQLLAAGVQPDSLRVHLGHSRPTSASARYRFLRYHPMLHSKVYLFDMPDDRSVAFVGSHNLTGFALNGLNGEASVRLEGPRSHPALKDIRSHVQVATVEATTYDPSQRDAYAWWSLQFAEGLSDKFRDTPRDGEATRTIVIVAEATAVPGKDDTIYFELPEGLGRVQSLKADIHLFLFDRLPTSPAQALAMLPTAKASVWCRTVGIEDDRGGRELQADWLVDPARSRLTRAPRPFRPTPARGMQQVRAQAYREVRGAFDYLFDDGKASFEPTFDRAEAIAAPAERHLSLQRLELIPREDQPWFRVTGLKRHDEARDDGYAAALRSLRPEAGSFILMSLRRRDRA